MILLFSLTAEKSSISIFSALMSNTLNLPKHVKCFAQIAGQSTQVSVPSKSEGGRCSWSRGERV